MRHQMSTVNTGAGDVQPHNYELQLETMLMYVCIVTVTHFVAQ